MARVFVVLIISVVVVCVSARRDSYYAILGVEKNADHATIKTAYRTKSLKYHPDKNKAKNAQEKFINAAEAYQVLSDPAKRAQYDRDLTGGRKFSGQTTITKEQAEALFEQAMDFLESDKLLDIVDMLGTQDPAEQTWTESWLKGLAKWGIKEYGPSITNFLKTSDNVDIEINGHTVKKGKKGHPSLPGKKGRKHKKSKYELDHA